MITTNRQRRFLQVIVATAFLLRLFLVLAMRGYDLPSDQDHYGFGYETGRVARSLAEGKGYSSPWLEASGPTALIPPLYPALLAGLFRVFGTYSESAAFAALALNAVFAAATCVVLFHLGRAMFGVEAGLVAAAIFAVYPASVFQSVKTIWDTNLFALALSVCVLLVWRAARAWSAGPWLAGGAAIGATSLVNPAGLSFLPAAMLWAWYRNPAPARRKTLWLAGAAGLAALVMAPWAARNYAVLGTPALRSGFGLELKLGDGAHSWWRDHPSFSEAEFAKYKAQSEIPYMRDCLREAEAFIVAHPAGYAGSVAKHFAQFWFGWPADGAPGSPARPAWKWVRA
ncbi:MAG TPA: glycosyltransferase family 39 protein, partial [Thiobacillus sp.]